MRANFTGFGRRKRGVSEIRCKDTSNILVFANFFAKKIQKNAYEQKYMCPDQIRTQGTKI